MPELEIASMPALNFVNELDPHYVTELGLYSVKELEIASMQMFHDWSVYSLVI